MARAVKPLRRVRHSVSLRSRKGYFNTLLNRFAVINRLTIDFSLVPKMIQPTLGEVQCVQRLLCVSLPRKMILSIPLCIR